MQAKQAYKGRVMSNGYDISDVLRGIQTNFDKGTLDVTTFVEDGWQENLPGMKSAVVEAEVLRKGELEGYQRLLSDALESNPCLLMYTPEGADVGNQAYILSASRQLTILDRLSTALSEEISRGRLIHQCD